jgi:hypothetical protein
MLITSTLLLALCLAVVSCKKKDHPAPAPTPTPTTSSLLTSSGWKTSKMSISTAGVSMDITQDCDKDNIDTYTAAGGYTHNTVTDNCDGSDETYTATYKLIDSDKKIVLDGDTLNISSISSNKLVLSQSAEGTTMSIEYVK